MLAKQRGRGFRNDRGEDEQESEARACGSLEGGRGVAAGVLAPLQPQEVHAAPVVRLPGAEGLLRAHVPRHDGIVGGRRLARLGDWAHADPALDHPAESGRPAADVALVPPPVVDDGRAREAGQDRSSARATGRRGHQRLRVAAHEPLLRPAAKNDRHGRAPAARVVSPLSEVGGRLRYREPLHSGGSRQPGPSAGLRRLRTVGLRGADPRGFEDDRRGRRLRQRSQSRIGPRRARDPVADSRRAWASGTPRADGSLSTADETPSARKPLRPAVASGNRVLDDQATQRRSRQRPHLLAPLPTPAS